MMPQGPTLGDAILELSPNAKFFIIEDNVEKIEWDESMSDFPTNEEILNKFEELKQRFSQLEYQRLRALEYPDFREYLDGIVKNDQTQIDAYISACQEVKNKYPKPEVSE